MINYNKDIESSYLEYLHANNFYGWAMSQKLPVDGFEWIKEEDLLKFNESFIKNYNENSDKGYILEVDVEYPENLHKLHSDSSFLPEKKKTKKYKKLICNKEDKQNYVIHIKALKQALNQGLILKKVHRVIQFSQEEWLKPYIDMNTKLRKEAKNEFEKDFFKQMNNCVYGKTMENVRNHRDIKIVTTNRQRSILVSKPNYHTIKHISKNLLIIETKKTEAKINKPIYLGLSILDILKTLMYEFWYDYIKPKYKDRAKSCYNDTDSCVVYNKTVDFYKDIANDVEKWFDTTMMKMIKDHFQ